MSEPALDLEAVVLESAAQLSDWVEVEGGQRVRLAFIPSGFWASILARQQAIAKGRKAVSDRIAAGESDDAAADCERLGALERQLLQVAGEVVAYSLREIDGQEPLKLEGQALNVSVLESLVLDGLFWPVHAAVMAAHWTDPDQARALFCRWLGQSV